jgi:hypothetical protein
VPFADYSVNGAFFVSGLNTLGINSVPGCLGKRRLLSKRGQPGFGALFLYIRAALPSQTKGESQMSESYQDSYTISFHSLADMMTYHAEQTKRSQWERADITGLRVEPLDEGSPLYGDTSAFALCVGEDAVKDTAKNIGLAIRFAGTHYPVRDTAYKSLLDRAKISGTSLPKLPREALARTLNDCLATQRNASALLLIREQKASAVHSGDEKDYSVLPIDELLDSLKTKLDERFPGNVFENGYGDHALASAAWSMPDQKDDLLGTYHKTLVSQGKAALAAKLMPGIRFSTSDTGVASAKVSALLLGLRYPIHIGGMVATEHRAQSKVGDFQSSLDMLFAQFEDAMARLEKLTAIYLDYPVNAMTAICKKLAMPKKAALEAVGMFEAAYGGGMATAHDVFIAMQEIMFICKTERTPESKLLLLEESMARALTLNWPQFDFAKAVGW